MNKSLKLLNEFEARGRSKVRTLNGVELTDYKSPIEFNKESSTCLVYTVWGNVSYLKWLYMSLRTLKTFTDLDTINIRIVTDRHLSNICTELFKDILPESCFITKPWPLSLKYNISNLPEFQRFENIIIWDTDAFVFNFEGASFPFFETMKSRIDTDSIILGFEAGSFHSVFMRMNKILNNTDPYWWYKNECDIQNIEEINMYYSNWSNSSFTMFKRRTVKTREYRNLCTSLLSHFHRCDETVYHVYSFIQGIKVQTLNDHGIDVISHDDFDKWFLHKEKGFIWTHPVTGNDIKLRCLKKFYEMVNTL